VKTYENNYLDRNEVRFLKLFVNFYAEAMLTIYLHFPPGSQNSLSSTLSIFGSRVARPGVVCIETSEDGSDAE
jgi:hypothetical protein